MKVSPSAGKPPAPGTLVNVPRLVTAYYAEVPDPSVPAQRVAFGTSGHRGSAFDKAFNESHILAITQAICLYRKRKKIAGPLFLGMDTHALSEPAFASALEVLAANGGGSHDRGRRRIHSDAGRFPRDPHATTAGAATGLADGIVITPSHNPPRGRRVQVRPAQRRPGGERRHRLDRGQGERVARVRPSRSEADPVRESPARGDDSSARLPGRLRRRPRQRD